MEPNAQNPVEDFTPQTQTENVPEKIKPPKKGVSLTAILSGLILVVVAIAAFFYFQNRQLKNLLLEETKKNAEQEEESIIPIFNPVEDWKTYSNDIYQIKYPGDFEEDDEDVNTFSITKVGPTQKDGTELYDGISISFEIVENYELQSYVDSQYENGLIEFLNDPEATIFNGYDAITYVIQGLGTFEHIVLETNDNGALVDITVLVSDPKNLGYRDTIDQILSTFKFIEEPEEALIPSPIPSSEATPSSLNL